MSTRSNETIWPSLTFLWTWWRLTYYPFFEAFAFLWAIALWFVGWGAIRMFSSTVHNLGFWGWVRLFELATLYGLALWLAPFEAPTTILLLWGVATPLLFIGNVWRRAYDRFPPVQSVMHGALNLFAAAVLIAAPVFAWRMGPDFLPQLALSLGAASAGCLALYYGWRLAAAPPNGQFDARIGTMDSFRLRGMSDER
jgi:hypothetical protein